MWSEWRTESQGVFTIEQQEVKRSGGREVKKFKIRNSKFKTGRARLGAGIQHQSDRMIRGSSFTILIAKIACVAAWIALIAAGAQAQVRLPGKRGGIVEIQAQQQRFEQQTYHLDGNVEITYQNLKLRGDRMQYNTESGEILATGNVRFELDPQFVQADEARYNLHTGDGNFTRVRGEFRIHRSPNDEVLVSENPLRFEAASIERVAERTWEVRDAWVTVCKPDMEIWKFYAPRAVIKLDSSVRFYHANFRLGKIPVIYLPVATAPAGRKLRQSGFLVPHVANSTRKGFVVGDSFYWAPVEWADLTVGAEYLSRRGYSQIAGLRVRPWEQARLEASYYAVNDRGLVGPGGVRVPQAGHETHVGLEAMLPAGWRAVADLNQLTSLNFRLAFAETFREAANPEIRSNAFLTNNFRGLSLNFFTVNYKNFLTATPETAVVLRSSPGARFSSVEQSPWARVPVYFGFEVSAEAMHRSDPGMRTPAAVQRTEIAPRITLPLLRSPWLGFTPSFTLRNTRYGSSMMAGTVVGDSVRRTTAEVTAEIRPPGLQRIFERDGSKWKHAVEPRILYRYVDGVGQFGRFIRFDENDTLTDTNEFEYSITQRVFRRAAAVDGQARELIRWRLAQKYYFDPTFGGALVPGQRNTFQALTSITPFAFALEPRRFSPVVSDLRVMPGGKYDAQVRIDYDPKRGGLATFGTLLNLHPYREASITLAHFATRADPLLQPKSHQVRALFGWGSIHRQGLNGTFGVSYDVRQAFIQNQVAQISWNGSCCGIGFEFRRLALGPLRSENQFRVAFMIANIGTFGNLRRQEKIFE